MKGSDTMIRLNRMNVTGAVVLGLGFLFASPCQAQPQIGGNGIGGPPVVGGYGGMGGFGQQPTISYLNLLRPGNPAVNYYSLVRPQQQAQSNFLSLQNQINPLNTAVTGMEQPLMTGHAFGFQNYKYYFQNQFMVGGFGMGMNQGMGGRAGQGVASLGMAGQGAGAGAGTGGRAPTAPTAPTAPQR